jgi:hypothetical protein
VATEKGQPWLTEGKQERRSSHRLGELRLLHCRFASALCEVSLRTFLLVCVECSKPRRCMKCLKGHTAHRRPRNNTPIIRTDLLTRPCAVNVPTDACSAAAEAAQGAVTIDSHGRRHGHVAQEARTVAGQRAAVWPPHSSCTHSPTHSIELTRMYAWHNRAHVGRGGPTTSFSTRS